MTCLEKFKNMKAVVQGLKIENISLQKKVESFEIYSRKNNLNMYNMKVDKDNNLELK